LKPIIILRLSDANSDTKIIGADSDGAQQRGHKKTVSSDLFTMTPL